MAAAQSFATIVPHATNPIATGATAKGIYCGGAGTVVVPGLGGTDVTFNVIAGQVLDIETQYVRATSTATGLIALY
jgi:hypothetical protein